MILHGESEGAGAVAVVILHGLMGSCENWRQVRAALSARHRVVCLDLPNHGRSPHVARFDLRSMGADVLETLRAMDVRQAVVVGHSLGGKVAMRLASDAPGFVRGLVVVDISPRAMRPVHLFVLRACAQLNLAAARRRSELDAMLAEAVPQPGVRDFLLKNVARAADGAFAWRVPLAYLIDHYRVVSDALALAAPYAGPALFVAGEASPFGVERDMPLVREWFPAARLAMVPAAGHLVHVENPDAFLEQLELFLAGL